MAETERPYLEERRHVLPPPLATEYAPNDPLMQTLKDRTTEVFDDPEEPIDNGARRSRAALPAPLYRLSNRVLIEQDDDQDSVIVIDIQMGTVCTSNPTAALLLSRLSEQASARDLARELAAHFSLDQGQALDDVRAFLHQLDAMGFLDIANE